MTEASLDTRAYDVPGFRIERLLGTGGFASVFAALSSAGERVALKVATPGDGVAAAQLAREEEAMRAVGAPPAPAVRAAGTLSGGTRWLAMELLQSPTLEHRLADAKGSLPLAEVALLAPSLADAVGAMHGRGVLHLDLKPANVFPGAQGMRLIDFGLARRIGERPARTRFEGTAEYASPEQCEERADLDARADIYALGVILFRMLTGTLPFNGDAQAVRDAQVGTRPPRPGHLAPVPASLEQVVLRCLSKDRARRFSSAAELKTALADALSQEAAEAHAPGQAPASAPARGLERRQVGLLFFSSQADVGSVQSAVRSLGAELGHAARGRYAAVFPGEAGQDPVRRAFRAAQGLAERALATRGLIDLGAVNAQRRADGSVRYISPELGREERYAKDVDPQGPLATAAAAEVLADVGWEPVPGRPALFVPRPGAGERLQAATVVQLGAGPLVGRDEVVREIVSSAKSAVESGGPAVVTVIAEPGHGKTHLAAAVLERLRAHLPVAEILDLRAREPVAGDANETLRALLTRALDLPPGAGEESGRARFLAAVGRSPGAELWPAAALVLRLVPADATRVRALSAAPGVLRSMAMRAAGEALRARARNRPLCLLVDDAQFADDTALDSLEYATLADASAPLFVCALARPAFAEARPSFGTRAARHEVHHLGPLPPDRAADLCRRLLAPAENVPAAAIERLVQRTQGVPLQLVELIRGLKRDGVVRKRQRGETWFLATDELDKLPDSPLIEWLAERELAALPRELAAHARLAALLGTEFGAEEVEGVVNQIDAEGLSAEFPLDAQVGTRRLASLGLLITTRTGAFRFRHALVRDAMVQSVPPPQRTRIHAAAARFYRSTRALPDTRRVPLLARHAAAAGLRDEAAALYLQLAAESAARHAYLDSERSYTAALSLLDAADRERRLAALRGRGSMRYRIGRYEDAIGDMEAARELARALSDPRAEAEILLDAATALDWMTDFVRSRALVGEAERLLGASVPPALQARLLLGHARSLFRFDRRAEACETFQRAAALAESVGDEAYETLIISLVMIEGLLPDLGRAEDAGRIAERAIALCRERGDQLHLTAALNNRRNLLVARKDAAGAIDDQLTFMRISRELGALNGEYYGNTNLAELLYYMDETERAAENARRAIQIEEQHPEVASRGPVGVLRLARIEAYRGNEAEARQLLARIDETLRRASGALSPSQALLRVMVDLASRDARPEEWQALLERSLRESVEQEPIEVAEMYGVWALRRGRVEEARRAFEEAAARAARIPNIMDARLRKGFEATGLRTT